MDSLKQFLELLLQEQVEHTTVVPMSGVYHISTNTISEFTPRVPRSGLSTEDTKVPRICTAATLLDCFTGYSRLLSNFEDSKSVYHIYRLPTEYVVKPDKTLLPDVSLTKELWVVGFDAAHAKVIPETVGEVSVLQLVTIGIGKARKYIITVLIKTFKDVPLSQRTVLPEGHYKVVVYTDNKVYWDIDDLGFTKLSAEEYTQLTRYSKTISVPPSHKW